MLRPLPRFLAVALLAGLWVCLLALPAWAHRVLVFALAEGDRLQVESKFVGSGPVQEGLVFLKDKASGDILATGKTDAQGKFSCPIPEAARNRRADLLVVVEADMGHRGEFLLPADRYLPSAAAKAAPAAPSPAAPAAAPLPQSPGTAATPPDLEAVLDRVLEKHLAPLKEMVAEAQVRKVTVQDVIGGIGYIVGFCGLAAYFLSRKKS